MSSGVIIAMGTVAIRTTDLEASVRDATDLLGLRVNERLPDRVYLSAAGVHHELVYIQSDANAVDAFGLVARDDEALAEIRRRVDDAGYPIVSDVPLEAGIDRGFAFEGPEGFVFQIYLGMEERNSDGPNYGPDRYGHINIHPRDVDGMKRFLQEVLDFMISDIIGDDFAYFLRCNPDHHGIALIAGHGTLHHHAWQTQSIADLGKLGDRMFAQGRRLIWGPVRHGAGHNIAAYFVEPAGSVIELYTDLEQIYDDLRPPILWSKDDRRWLNKWGVYNGEDFRSHGLAPARREN
ncbi:catechol 2,3-dioxygenase [Arthrobacter sp. GAS37]|uniref:VOC family protein n=1 Tax=Arthrobacter sp. GAS37 TaxID=3156261 RepID=UPI003837C158